MDTCTDRQSPLLPCIIACLCASLLVSGCVQMRPTPEPATIRFAFVGDWEIEHYQRLVTEFNERYPHIAVELDSIPWQSQGGFAPDRADVFSIWDQASFAEWQRQGAIVDLMPYIEQDKRFDLDDLYPVAVEFYALDGRQWAIPSYVDPIVMFYNVDLFDRYGVAYPETGWTWEDLLDKAIALRDPGQSVFGFGADPQDVILFVHQHGGQILDDWRNPSHTTFDHPLTLETVQWYDTLVNEYDAAPTLDQAAIAFPGFANIYYGFLEDKVAMIMSSFSSQGGATWGEWQWEMQWAMVPLPRDQVEATLAACSGYALSATSLYREAGWTWISFLSEQVPLYGVPARRSLAESEAFSKHVGAEAASVGQYAAQHAWAPYYARGEAAEAIENFGAAVDYVINQDMAPLEALEWVQRRATFK